MSFEAIPQGEAVGLKLSTILLRLMYDPQCPGWRSSHSLLIDSAWIGALHEYDAARHGRWQREADSAAEDEIVRRIHDAVIEQRLPPGTKLSEAALCEAFGVGRARVRRSLVVLAGREIVELHANRGAFVARPTPEQARDIFDARRAIEPGIVRRAIARATERDLRRLEEHLQAETGASGHRDRRHAIRLSGHFHVILAEIAGNRVLERMVGELVTRTSLIIGMFGGPGPTTAARTSTSES